MNKENVMHIVNAMCNTESSNCRSLNKADLAKQLLTLASVPTTADIQEIPVDWDNMVTILFLLPNDNKYYSLFAGIGMDNNFHFELSVTGLLSGDMFDFYDEEQLLDINHFMVA